MFKKQHSEETKAKISASLMGRKVSVETREKISVANRGENRYNWKGGRRVFSSGYVEVRVDGKGVLEHRYVMQKILGRALTSGESVHHLNGIRDDNRPENLELWTKPQPTGIRSSDAKHCPTCTCGQH